MTKQKGKGRNKIRYLLILFQNIIQHTFTQKDNKEILKALIWDIIITHAVILEHFPPQNANTIASSLSKEVINSYFKTQNY